MTKKQIARLFDELQDADCTCEMSDLLSPLSYDDLQTAHEDLLDQFGHELAMGALEQSGWLCGNLLINANQGSVSFLGMVLDVVRAEMNGRKAMAEPANGLLN
jgi:hypothetical protein